VVQIDLRERLGSLEVRLDGALAALVSEAEQARIALNNEGGQALAPRALAAANGIQYLVEGGRITARCP
jgi:hypothetical protein